jgi:hypothetical protein
VILAGPTQKTAISAFAGISTKYTQIPNTQVRATIQSSADFYVSEYGVHQLVLHRHVRSSVILQLDLDLLGARVPAQAVLGRNGEDVGRHEARDACGNVYRQP